MSASSDSEDPDEVEVPGGGRDLASLITIKDDDEDPEVTGMLNLVKKAKKKKKNEDLLNTSGQSDDSLIMLVPNMFQLPGNNPKEETKTQNLNNPNNPNQIPGFLPMNEDSHEEEGMGVAETYADYKPRKVLIGVKHPDAVVESTSLAGVEPADVHYKVILPADTISSGALSSLQLESITYASQQHEKILQDGTRAGFLVGDGAGVGKGRTIAGIIFENYLRKRKKSVWVSVLSDLKYDSERDLKDIGAPNIKVYALNKLKYCKIDSEGNGNITKGVIFCTYSSLIAKSNQCSNNFKTRFLQLIDWCGPDFDGVIVFDECHRAKNLAPAGNSKPTKTGLSVLNLQKKLPKARVVYASATGATEPRNMAYMVRLGLWGPGTPFSDFPKFLAAMEMRGVGAMEILAMEMKQRGMYIARQLSFHGVSFRVVEVPLTEKFIKIYDRSTKLWTDALEKFKEAASLVSTDKTVLSSMWSLFWSAHQRFFKCLCIAAKVKEAVYISREAIKCGKCVVIGLQSTGEARLLEQMQKDDGELSDFVSSARGVLETLVEKHFPTDTEAECDSYSNDNSFNGFKRKPQSKPKVACKKRKILDTLDMLYSDSDGEVVNDYYDDDKSLCLKTSDNRQSINSFNTNGNNENNTQTSWENSQKALELKKELLAKIKKLGKKLPPNALDDLIDELGGPENVAEMTGRKGRVVQTDNGFQYESRSEADTPLEILNIVEKQRFMNGEKDVAIISEVASSGISLHSDRRAANRKSRVHITLELPWSADRAIQQFGRTHRSNQASAPEYVFLISDLAGERRFASVVAKRLESLGALTHGDRRATETRDFSRFNIDNNYGRTAMEVTLKTLIGSETPRVSFPKNYDGNFVQDACKALTSVGLLTKNENYFILANERRSLSRFLNRLLGLPVKLQNCLFDYFTATMEAIIAEAKKMGVYDVGILDLAGNECNVKRLGSERFRWLEGTGEVVVDLHRILVERGMAWAHVLSLWHNLGEEDGDFWLSQQVRGGKREVIMAVAVKRTETKSKERAFIIYRPNIGEQMKRESKSWLEGRFKQASREEAEAAWKDHYEGSARACSHEHWGGKCSVRAAGETCELGLRQRVYHVISGSVLRLWPTLETVLSHKYGNSSRLQVIRLSTCDGAKIVGTLIPTPCVAPLHRALSNLASQRQLL